MAEYAIKTNQLTKQFGLATALDKVDMHLTRGIVYGLAGKDGSGKSTLVRVISGLQEPTAGEYELFGTLNTDRVKIGHERRRVGVVMGVGAFIPTASIRKNLERQCKLLGVPGRNRTTEVLRMTGLEHWADRKAEQLAGEKQVAAAIAMAMCGSPDLLILDDVWSGLSLQQMSETGELLRRLKMDYELTILITAQDPESLNGFADQYGVLDHGVLRRELSAEEIMTMRETALRVRVSDTNVLARVLVEKSLQHRILSADVAEIYGKPNITELVTSLAAAGCEVLTIEETSMQTESLLQAISGGEQ